MIVISFGYTCYVRWLLNKTKYTKEYDLFDWMCSYEFSKLIFSLENDFDFMNQVYKLSHVPKDESFLNDKYAFRIPHEAHKHETKIEIIEKFHRKIIRFLKYKENQTDDFLFIRIINNTTSYETRELENIQENYSEECYNRLMKFLPPKSKVLLLSDLKLTPEERLSIYKKFYVLDDIVRPENIIYGEYSELKYEVLGRYIACLEYIENNFNDLDVDWMQKILSKEHIGRVGTFQ